MAAFGPPQSAVPLSGPVVLPDSHAPGILFLPREVIMKVRWLCQYNLIVSCHEAQRVKVAGKKNPPHREMRRMVVRDDQRAKSARLTIDPI